MKDWTMSNITAEEHKKHAGLFYKYSVKNKTRKIIEYIRKGDKGLDVGAGCGQYTEELNTLGYDVLALEPNEKLIKGAKCPKIVCRGDKTPFEDDEFDFSFAIAVLHHAEDPLAVVKEMGRVSKRIIIQETNKKSLVAMLFSRIMPVRVVEDTSKCYDENGLKRLVEEAGLEVVDSFKQGVFGVFRNTFIWVVCEKKGEKNG